MAQSAAPPSHATFPRPPVLVLGRPLGLFLPLPPLLSFLALHKPPPPVARGQRLGPHGAAFTPAASALVPQVPQLELKSALSGPDSHAQKLTHQKWTVQGIFSNIVVPPPESRYGTFYHPTVPPEPCTRGSPGAPGRPDRTSVLRRRLCTSSREAHRAALGAWLLVLITEPWRHLSVTARWATEAATTASSGRCSSAHQPSDARFPGRLRPLPAHCPVGTCCPCSRRKHPGAGCGLTGRRGLHFERNCWGAPGARSVECPPLGGARVTISGSRDGAPRQALWGARGLVKTPSPSTPRPVRRCLLALPQK